MKKILASLVLLVCALQMVFAQENSIALYKKTSAMIPMRDGIKLNTVILTPVDAKTKVPILILRTPYGAGFNIPDDTTVKTSMLAGYYNNMLADGYIMVLQDIRGKYKSEGDMQIHQPLIHQVKKGAIDESTDTWDTVDWLVKNAANNNGKAGIFGISYPGWLALVGAVDPHLHSKRRQNKLAWPICFLAMIFITTAHFG